MKKYKANIFIADKIDESGINFLKRKGYLIIPFYGLDNNELIKVISNYEKRNTLSSVLIIRSVRQIRKKEIDNIYAGTRIGCIATASSGYDNIDFEYAKKLKLKIINVPDGNFIPAAEHTLTLILGIFKHIGSAKLISAEDFKKSVFTNHELYGKSIGIIGVGRVGSHLAKLCRAFGMKIYGNDIKKNLYKRYPWIHFCNLTELVKSSDIVTVHTPLDETTRNLIDRNLIGKMKKGVVLINCARGGIVDENALIDNLARNKIAFAGLDVFENEPVVNAGLGVLENVLLTPHQAGKTVESRVRISGMLAGRLHAELTKMAKRKKPKLKN